MQPDTLAGDPATDGGTDRFAEFGVGDARERLQLLQRLRDGALPVILSAHDGACFTTTLWAVDETAGRLAFAADGDIPQLQRLVEADDAVAVAYLDGVQLQFDLHDLLLVHGGSGSALQAGWPQMMWRFQRRQAYRVRPPGRQAPVATLRHPSMPEMTLRLRVLDVSIGGCALLLPHDLPNLQPGTAFGEVTVELDPDTRLRARLLLHHVTSIMPGERGVRLGCSWTPLDGAALRALQRWIDQTQKRRRLLALD